MGRTLRSLFLAVVLAASAMIAAHAAIPRTLSYQGFLTGTGGVPVNTTVTMQFRLFETSSGGTELWSETQSVNVANGIFNVVLGSITALAIPFDKQYFLEMKVGADAPMTPRQALQSAPTALAAFAAGCGVGDYVFCYSGPAGTEGVGQCRTGRRTCNPVTLQLGVCTGSIGPTPEVIDGIDNDCDGTIDNLGGVPTVIGVTSTTANGTYGINAPINVSVTFNEPVIVNLGGDPPLLALNSGGTANYISGSNTATLSFSHQVAAGQNSVDLDYMSTSSLTLPTGTTLKDSSGNDAIRTLPTPGATGSLGFNKSIVVDTTGPSITDVTSSTANGSYGPGSVIVINVTFSEPVFVAGLPQLTLNSGGAAFHTGTSGNAVQSFSYTVQAGQSTADLEATSLTSGTISDSAVNFAIRVLPVAGATGSLSFNKAIVITP